MHRAAGPRPFPGLRALFNVTADYAEVAAGAAPTKAEAERIGREAMAKAIAGEMSATAECATLHP